MDPIFLSISPTSLDHFLLCPRFYLMNGIYGYKAQKGQSTLAMDMGMLGHMMLEWFYRAKMELRGVVSLIDLVEPIQSKARFFVDSQEEEDKFPLEEVEHYCDLFKEYVIRYTNENWTPLAVEESFSKLFYHSETLTVLLEGRIDLMIEYDDKFICPVDHKFKSRNEKISPLDTQFISYAWATDSNRLIMNGIQTKTEDEKLRFDRQILNYEKEVLEEWHQDMSIQMRFLDLYLQNQYFPGNTSSCSKSKYGKCKFTKICELEDSLRPTALEGWFVKSDKEYDLFAGLY